MLGWSQVDLAKKVGVTLKAIRNVEDAQPSTLNLEVVSKVRKTLEDAGIEFLPATSDRGIGVRWKSPTGSSGTNEV